MLVDAEVPQFQVSWEAAVTGRTLEAYYVLLAREIFVQRMKESSSFCQDVYID